MTLTSIDSKIIKITGNAVPILGNDIDTDRIVPARFLKEITFDNMGEYLFYDVRFDKDGSKLSFPLNEENFKDGTILIVNKNFGCGSSREHAPQAIKRYGIKAIIGESFAEIFSGNCKELGLPLVTLKETEIQELQHYLELNFQEPLMIDLQKKEISIGNSVYRLNISEDRRTSFLEGTWDSLGLLKQNLSQVVKIAKALPYNNNFSGGN